MKYPNISSIFWRQRRRGAYFGRDTKRVFVPTISREQAFGLTSGSTYNRSRERAFAPHSNP